MATQREITSLKDRLEEAARFESLFKDALETLDPSSEQASEMAALYDRYKDVYSGYFQEMKAKRDSGLDKVLDKYASLAELSHEIDLSMFTDEQAKEDIKSGELNFAPMAMIKMQSDTEIRNLETKIGYLNALKINARKLEKEYGIKPSGVISRIRTGANLVQISSKRRDALFSAVTSKVEKLSTKLANTKDEQAKEDLKSKIAELKALQSTIASSGVKVDLVKGETVKTLQSQKDAALESVRQQSLVPEFYKMVSGRADFIVKELVKVATKKVTAEPEVAPELEGKAKETPEIPPLDLTGIRKAEAAADPDAIKLASLDELPTELTQAIKLLVIEQLIERRISEDQAQQRLSKLVENYAPLMSPDDIGITQDLVLKLYNDIATPVYISERSNISKVAQAQIRLIMDTLSKTKMDPDEKLEFYSDIAELISNGLVKAGEAIPEQASDIAVKALATVIEEERAKPKGTELITPEVVAKVQEGVLAAQTTELERSGASKTPETEVETTRTKKPISKRPSIEAIPEGTLTKKMAAYLAAAGGGAKAAAEPAEGIAAADGGAKPAKGAETTGTDLKATAKGKEVIGPHTERLLESAKSAISKGGGPAPGA